jgi:16S rRNA (uracil1498-N3)-methyltransferase
LLRVKPLTDWTDYVRRSDLPLTRVLAHPQQDAASQCRFFGGVDVALAVGPEGGFTEEEVSVAVQAGWQVWNLGPRILRVETAAIVMAARASCSAATGG